MPRPPVVQKGGQQQQLAPKKINLTAAEQQQFQAEWRARGCRDDIAAWAIAFSEATGDRLSQSDPNTSDPGPWSEIWWRFNIRTLGDKGFELTKQHRSFTDRPLDKKTSEDLERRAADLQNASLAEQNRINTQIWGGVDAKERGRALLKFTQVARHRPHGFKSVGRQLPDSHMGKLLLHGLQVFLATACDPLAMLQLHKRHCRSVCINPPQVELYQYGMTYTDSQGPSTFTGLIPPAAAQVPLFDHLSLHWQLQMAVDVIAGIVHPGCSHGPEEYEYCSQHDELPPDDVYHWAAFNKLLLLGMYAPVEEAHAGPRQVPLVRQQLHQLAAARVVEAGPALTDLQQSLQELRCVLHEQLEVEVAVGQAALQMYWASHNHPPDTLVRLQQQLRGCQASDIWSQSSSITAEQQSQQLVLLVSSLLAWPLSVLTQDCTAAASAQVLSWHSQSISQQQHAQPIQLCLQQLNQLVYAAANGVEQLQPSSSSSLMGGLGGLWNAHKRSSATSKQQQQEPQQPHQQLLGWLLQLLEPVQQQQLKQQRQRPSATSSRASSSGSNMGSGGGSLCSGGGGSNCSGSSASSSSSSSLSGDELDASCDPVMCLQLQAFSRAVRHVLLLRLLAAAPPCEAWPWEVCVHVLQLLLSMQQLVSMAGGILFQSLSISQLLNQHPIHQRQQKQQQQQKQAGKKDEEDEDDEEDDGSPGGLLPPDFHHILRNDLQTELQCYLAQLQKVLAHLHKAEDLLLQDSTASGSSSTSTGHATSSSSNSQPHIQQQQRRRQHHQHQQGESQEGLFAGPTFWRSQAMSLYKSSRPSGSRFLQHYFSDFEPSNDKPGFWGVISRLACADQLNLRHAEAPPALAATQPPAIDCENLLRPDNKDNRLYSAVMSKQLARQANMQLVTKFVPPFPSANDGVPVQPMALRALMQAALIAVHQPQLFAYANADGKAAAAAAKAGAAKAAGNSTSTSAAAAADAAAAAWEDAERPFHLSTLLLLGPLFEQSQQGPCLVRLMQLLLQYHTDCAAGAQRALQRLEPVMRVNQLWVPNSGGGSSGGSGSSRSNSNNSTGQHSKSSQQVPPQRSRLLVLLMGLFHVQALEEQQHRQSKQALIDKQQQLLNQFKQQRQQQGGASFSADAQQQQQQQQPQPQQQQKQQHLRPSRAAPRAGSNSDAAAAAAPAGAAAESSSSSSVYDDQQLCHTLAAAAANAAYDLQDLLLYCLTPLENASLSPNSTRSSNTTSSSSRPRFEVCPVTDALVRDGTSLLCQDPVHVTKGAPIDAYCDACSSRCMEPAFNTLMTGASVERTFLQPPPPAPPHVQIFCSYCGSAKQLCKKCEDNSDISRMHGMYCYAGAGSIHEARVSIIRKMLQEAGTSGGTTVPNLHQLSPTNVAREDPCRCSLCSVLLKGRKISLQMLLLCSPLAQSCGPWAQPLLSGQDLGGQGWMPPSCPLGVAGFGAQLPQHVAAVVAAFKKNRIGGYRVGRFEERLDIVRDSLQPLHELLVEYHADEMKLAAAAAGAAAAGAVAGVAAAAAAAAGGWDYGQAAGEDGQAGGAAAAGDEDSQQQQPPPPQSREECFQNFLQSLQEGAPEGFAQLWQQEMQQNPEVFAQPQATEDMLQTFAQVLQPMANMAQHLGQAFQGVQGMFGRGDAGPASPRYDRNLNDLD